MAVKYVGERVGRYDRYEKPARKNQSRWMSPQPVGRRANRHYEYETPAQGADCWLNAIVATVVFVVTLSVIALIAV